MRIACYGFVDADAGSVAGANYLIIRHLLHRNHTIDFFAKRDFVHPESLFTYEGFTYFGVERGKYLRVEELADAIPFSSRPLQFAADQLSYNAHMRLIQRKLLKQHAKAPYDVALFLGTSVPFTIPVANLPVVAWVQGPPQTEIEAIQRHKQQINSLCGPTTYSKLRAFYLWRDWSSIRKNRRADAIICGSRWARGRILETGTPDSTVFALPYPFDLSFFQFLPRENPSPPTFGWLGRVVPRKRLDLLISAFEKVVQKYPKARLDVVGHFGQFHGFRSILDNCNIPNSRIKHRDSIPRSAVPEYLRSLTALVQPSENENFGSSVAEAMAVGTPAIVGPLNGTAEYAKGGCYHFDEYTRESLADSMIQCLEDQLNDAQGIAVKARSAAERLFDPETVVGHLERILRQTKRGVATDPSICPAPVHYGGSSVARQST